MALILQIMVLLPLVGAAVVVITARQGLNTSRWVTLAIVLATFALSVPVVMAYDPHPAIGADGVPGDAPPLIQMTSSYSWLGTPVTDADGKTTVYGADVRYSLGVDGISLWLIALTALLMIPAVLVSWEAIQERPAAFYALMLTLESGMLGVFAAQDIILFYIFFEFTLIPLFFMIGLWGGYDRRWAARKFFIYTLAGSLFTFLGLLFIVLSHSWMSGGTTLTFSIPQLTEDIPALTSMGDNQRYWMMVSPWIFAALFAGFAIKVPLFPFHTWLPLAHVEAPTAGSVLLAGVLLKIGSYGFLRFMLPLVPHACWLAVDIIAILAVVGIIYGALLALAQDDIKKLVAYSSVSHMGFCLLGLFALNAVGISGGLLQMINHGLSTGALFALVGMLYERYHTRDIEAFGGLTRKYPVMAFFFVLVAFSSIGLPGLNGFTGEVLSLLGMFYAHPVYGILSLSGIVLGAWYMLSLVARIMYGRLREPASETLLVQPAQSGHGHDHHGELTDLNFRELAALIPVTILIVWIGLYPQYFLNKMQPSIAAVVQILEDQHPTPAETARNVVPAVIPQLAGQTDTLLLPAIAKD